MKILVACEESQAVTSILRKMGHKAWSCDLQSTSGPMPQYHLQVDVTTLLTAEWDMVIAFPPCTDLCVSGARWFKQKQADGSQQRSIAFFRLFTDLPHIPRVAIENPIGIMSTLYRKPDQIVHPWQYGHGETKATCLWLKGLPLLVPTDIVEGRENRIHRLPPTADRGKLRSKTFEGIALAMAQQWTGGV